MLVPVVVLAALLSTTALVTAPAALAQGRSHEGVRAAAATTGYPTWADVQQAKHSASAKAAEVKRIKGLLDGLESTAADLGQKSIQAAATAQRAEDALRTATATARSLKKQGAKAGKRAETARRQAGAVTTQLYRSGDPTLSLWLSGRSSGTLLSRLGALDQISGSSSAMLRQAVADRRQADALGAQAKVAGHLRDGLANKAESSAAAAKLAQQRADDAVAANKVHTDQLSKQLTSLQSKYAATKHRYDQAVAAKAAAARRGATGSGTLGSVSGGSGSLSPGGAQAYAASRIGAYGWGSGEFTCLRWLWVRESGWRWDAYNASSGAYGIAQSLPASKYASAGSDWETSSATQIEWGLGYIQARYGSPCAAWSHETSHNWY